MAMNFFDRTVLTTFLHDKIPLTQAMTVEVLEAGFARLILRVPLAPNLNHHGTAFGGSLSTAGTVAAWTWLYASLQSLGFHDAKIVVVHSESEFFVPVREDFSVEVHAPDETIWETFLAKLRQKNRGSVPLTALVCEGGKRAFELRGVFHVSLGDA